MPCIVSLSFTSIVRCLTDFSVALLSAARNYKNVQLAERVLARMSTLFADVQQAITSATVLLGNIYGSLGDTEKSSTLRLELTRSGVKKVVGASWTAPDGTLAVCVF